MAISSQETPQLSVVIINYQTDDLILDLLTKLGSDPNVEIIIVDNSPRNSLQIKLRKKFPHIKYYFPRQNLGFAGGNNFGIRRSSGEWILLLNSDTSTSLKEIKTFIKATQSSGHLVAAPRLVDKTGQIENNVGYFDSLLKHPINWLLVRPRFLDCQSINSSISVDLLTGAAMLIHHSVFDLNGLLDDQNFFMYFEDIDFSYRLHRLGIKVLYVPSITIIHFQGASSNQDLKQKTHNYLHGLQAYLTKHRGRVIEKINHYTKLFE